MNIIEKVQEILSSYPQISMFTNEVDIDLTSDDPVSYGLSSVGDELVRGYVTGKELRQHNFVLYAVQDSFNTFKRLANSTFLLELGYWLKDKKNIEVDEGRITSIRTSNGMAYEIPTGDINDGVRYQIQIFVQYEKEDN